MEHNSSKETFYPNFSFLSKVAKVEFKLEKKTIIDRVHTTSDSGTGASFPGIFHSLIFFSVFIVFVGSGSKVLFRKI